MLELRENLRLVFKPRGLIKPLGHFHLGNSNELIRGTKRVQCVDEQTHSESTIQLAVLLYFSLRSSLGTETVSWVCILGAAPFAAMGFVSYHGMTAEQLFWAFLKSEALEPKTLTFEPVNAYFEALNGTLEAGYMQR